MISVAVMPSGTHTPRPSQLPMLPDDFFSSICLCFRFRARRLVLGVRDLVSPSIHQALASGSFDHEGRALGILNPER
jgi:hypothetical protein